MSSKRKPDSRKARIFRIGFNAAADPSLVAKVSAYYSKLMNGTSGPLRNVELIAPDKKDEGFNLLVYGLQSHLRELKSEFGSRFRDVGKVAIKEVVDSSYGRLFLRDMERSKQNAVVVNIHDQDLEEAYDHSDFIEKRCYEALKLVGKLLGEGVPDKLDIYDDVFSMYLSSLNDKTNVVMQAVKNAKDALVISFLEDKLDELDDENDELYSQLSRMKSLHDNRPSQNEVDGLKSRIEQLDSELKYQRGREFELLVSLAGQLGVNLEQKYNNSETGVILKDMTELDSLYQESLEGYIDATDAILRYENAHGPIEIDEGIFFDLEQVAEERTGDYSNGSNKDILQNLFNSKVAHTNSMYTNWVMGLVELNVYQERFGLLDDNTEDLVARFKEKYNSDFFSE
ncbi:hypothetical protein HOA92_06190 [archaeon]|jgi:hypothetical protein|nr:hypothetical protein [archaeon]MBT6762600.1 hypothetical protein [archaeon]